MTNSGPVHRINLPLSRPGPSPCMSNMDEPHLGPFNAPIDQIRIPAGRKHARHLFPRTPTTLREFPDQFNRLLDSALYVPRSARASLIDVRENRWRSLRARGV
jgi:hypothetical protein